MEVIGFIATCPTYLLTKMPCLYNRLVTCDSFQNVLPRRGGFQSYPPSSCLHFLRITALVGCVLRIWLGLPPSSTCAPHIEGNDRPETSCRTEGIDSRPVSLLELLQPPRLALSFSATSIRHSSPKQVGLGREENQRSHTANSFASWVMIGTCAGSKHRMILSRSALSGVTPDWFASPK